MITIRQMSPTGPETPPPVGGGKSSDPKTRKRPWKKS